MSGGVRSSAQDLTLPFAPAVLPPVHGEVVEVCRLTCSRAESLEGRPTTGRVCVEIRPENGRRLEGPRERVTIHRVRRKS